MFADDTNLFFAGKSIADLERTINEEMSAVSDWFQANLLSLNIKKTSYIIFGNKVARNLSMSIKIQDLQIQ